MVSNSLYASSKFRIFSASRRTDCESVGLISSKLHQKLLDLWAASVEAAGVSNLAIKNNINII